MQEVETPKPRCREKTRHAIKKNVDGERTLHIATSVGNKSKHEMTPRDYRVTTINVKHSS